MTAAIRPDNSVQCVHWQNGTKIHLKSSKKKKKNTTRFCVKIEFFKNREKHTNVTEKRRGAGKGAKFIFRWWLYFFISRQSGFTGIGKSTYGPLAIRHFFCWLIHTMLASRIKKKMLLNYSFCGFFFFCSDVTWQFVGQKIFLRSLLLCISRGHAVIFVWILNEPRSSLRSLNRTLCVYHQVLFFKFLIFTIRLSIARTTRTFSRYIFLLCYPRV